MIATHDDISDIHHEHPDFKYCERWDLRDVVVPQEDDSELKDEVELKILVEMEKLVQEEFFNHFVRTTHFEFESDDYEFDWRDEIEVWFRYNVPNVPAKIDKRIELLAARDAIMLGKSLTEVEIAFWLQHFNGYARNPFDLEQREREAFISDEYDDDRYRVSFLEDGGESFSHEDDAYTFFVEHYDTIYERVMVRRGQV